MEEIEFKISNTKDLQLFSVIQAMGTLGYQLMRTERNGYIFYNPTLTKFGKSLMSMQRAIMLHNCISPTSTHGCDAYTVNMFLAAKVVHNVKLQYWKRKKRISVNGAKSAHLVAFVDPAYAELFHVIQPS